MFVNVHILKSSIRKTYFSCDAYYVRYDIVLLTIVGKLSDN